MGHQFIKQIHTHRAGKHAGDGKDQAILPAVLQRRQHQTHHRRRQHHACGKGQDYIAEFVGNILKKKAQGRAKDGGAAHAQGSE